MRHRTGESLALYQYTQSTAERPNWGFSRTHRTRTGYLDVQDQNLPAQTPVVSRHFSCDCAREKNRRRITIAQFLHQISRKNHSHMQSSYINLDKYKRKILPKEQSNHIQEGIHGGQKCVWMLAASWTWKCGALESSD